MISNISDTLSIVDIVICLIDMVFLLALFARQRKAERPKPLGPFSWHRRGSRR